LSSVKEKLVKAASTKETTLPMPHVVSNKQSGETVVIAPLSKSTVKKKQKKSEHDATTTLKTPKKILKKTPAKESVSSSVKESANEKEKKTTLKEAVLTECSYKEMSGDNDIGGVTVGIENMSGENRFLIFYFTPCTLMHNSYHLKCSSISIISYSS